MLKENLLQRNWRGTFKVQECCRIWILQQKADLDVEAGCTKQLMSHTEVSVRKLSETA